MKFLKNISNNHSSPLYCALATTEKTHELLFTECRFQRTARNKILDLVLNLNVESLFQVLNAQIIYQIY